MQDPRLHLDVMDCRQAFEVYSGHVNLKGADALGLAEGASSACERAREELSVSHAMGEP